MCGIVGATSHRAVENILIEGLKRLEYRGYDSAGLAVIDHHGTLQRVRSLGKVQALAVAAHNSKLSGHCGIAHTRWATHGVPAEKNTHPFVSADNVFAVVHNGIIENHQALRKKLLRQHYTFTSDTDTETIVHLLHFHYQTAPDILTAIQNTVAELTGAYALGILSAAHPNQLMLVRQGSPLVIGCGKAENFFASDPIALLPITQRFIYLEEGDIAIVKCTSIDIYNKMGEKVTHAQHDLALSLDTTQRVHKHYMCQEIFQQPTAVRACLAQPTPFSTAFVEQLPNIQHIQFIACGTSFHAALVARYWLERLTGIACGVDVASEFRYRDAVLPANTLAIFISQSGETADTLAALRLVRARGNVKTLAICNVATSSLVHEADFHCLTHAGVEMGVASTKAFTTQLTALLLLAHTLAPTKIGLNVLQQLPHCIEQALLLDETIKNLAGAFTDKTNALFIGRDILFPVALEGALKLKEISYIHAEAYPAGELKHGPLALVDKNMPVIALAPHNILFDKMCSSINQVAARGGNLWVLTDDAEAIKAVDNNATIITLPTTDLLLLPILYTIPLQLFAYHVAVAKGTDVDQPRNLAKSVTVE